MAENRGSSWGWPLLLLVGVVAGALLIVLWPKATPRSAPPTSATSPAAVPTAPPTLEPPAPASKQRQPSASGYEYVLADEHYLVQQDDGHLEIQERRRESWRAPDGWTWARQTGTDPGQFIFPPSKEWKSVEAVPPNAADQTRVLSRAVRGTKVSDTAGAKFAFVQDLLGSESVPASAMPKTYRKGLVDALARGRGVDVTTHAVDPRGRDSIQIALAGPTTSTQSLFLDHNYRYLANTSSAPATGEEGSRVVAIRRHAATVPNDLLLELGTARVEKVR